MKLYSWNVNGLRACMTKGFAEFLQEAAPDIICLQEFNHSFKGNSESDNIGLFSTKYPYYFNYLHWTKNHSKFIHPVL